MVVHRGLPVIAGFVDLIGYEVELPKGTQQVGSKHTLPCTAHAYPTTAVRLVPVTARLCAALQRTAPHLCPSRPNPFATSTQQATHQPSTWCIPLLALPRCSCSSPSCARRC